MNTYAAYYDHEIRLDSSSGGLFSVIASEFDIVYGVAMTKDNYGAEFIRAERDISALRGSKYLQATLGDTFKLVKEDLINGKRVLFTGTGCQINGLSHFLKKEYSNLFLLDVVCHGVPSHKVWRGYLKEQEKNNGKVTTVHFRCKKNGWKDFGLEENQKFIPMSQNSYMQLFLRNYCLRPSCYECHAKEYKCSDMTIADFWGIEEIVPEMYDENGVSLVIVRTEKAQDLFSRIRSSIVCTEVSYEDGVKENSAEYKSVERPIQRAGFYNDLNSKGYRYAAKKYLEGPTWKRTARKIKKILRGGGA